MTEHAQRPTAEILLVEDSLSDARLILEALKQGKLTNHVSHVQDGDEALQFLRRQGPFADVPRPDLVLLDLMLPKKSGIEVLDEIKRDYELKAIPVVVLTASAHEEDKVKCQMLQVDAFITNGIVRSFNDSDGVQ